MSVRKTGPYSSGVAAGSAGSAANNADTPKLTGEVVGIYVQYNDSPPNTTDVVIKTKGTSPACPSMTLLTLTNKNTDNYFPVRRLVNDGVGVDVAGVYDKVPIDDRINIDIAGANANDYVKVWLFIDGAV